MEIVEGKATNKKIIIAQEIAFAKVLAGNNKTLRDRALRKLRRWLSVRGNGKWVFSEDEFVRIWTGLFYCMWMSDKFLIQEKLAEDISNLIHCFRKNKKSALLFIKSFNKRLLMEYEGLDQYRIDKFHMLIRRFLRQCFVYCKRIQWDDGFLQAMTKIFSDVILNNNSALGYLLHFMNIYLEELAKISEGKLENKKLLLLIEPFIKLLATSNDDRILTASLEFFDYLMRQTDVGLEFNEKFNVWKKLGFPGTGLNSIKKQPISNGHFEGDVDDSFDDQSDYESELEDKPLDPRAGSVHVDLPQIAFDIDSLINLFKKYERMKSTNPKSKRKIRTLIQKFSALRRGKFPVRVKKDPILDDNRKKKRLTIKTAKNLLKFTENIDNEPIKSKEFVKISKELQKQEIQNSENDLRLKNNKGNLQNSQSNACDKKERKNISSGTNGANENGESKKKISKKFKQGNLNGIELKRTVSEPGVPANFKNASQNNKVAKKSINLSVKNDSVKKNKKKKKKLEKANSVKMNIGKEDVGSEENTSENQNTSKKTKRKSKKKKVRSVEGSIRNPLIANGVKEAFSIQINKREETQVNGNVTREFIVEEAPENDKPINKKNGVKRKAFNDWIVQDLNEENSGPRSIKCQRTEIPIKLNKIEETFKRENPKIEKSESKIPQVEKKQEVFCPVFWERAKAKALNTKKKAKKNTIFVNPLASKDNSDCSNLRRISFALEKNMAQENDEYLEEVRNSPKVPFDGSKKPVQSALKSGLSPSPINPFYRFKKIKF